MNRRDKLVYATIFVSLRNLTIHLFLSAKWEELIQALLFAALETLVENYRVTGADTSNRDSDSRFNNQLIIFGSVVFKILLVSR